jgi:hypothetical protein
VYSKEEADIKFENKWVEVFQDFKEKLKKKRIIFDQTS